jgi:hypothetical protein
MADAKEFEGALIRLHRLAEARALLEVKRTTHEGAPALAVDDTPFVYLVEPHVAALHCPVDQKVLLLEISPEIFFETDSHIGKNILLVRLDQIEDEDLALKLEDAWHFRAPERLKR